ncbi:MAG: hypothetical protein K2O67_00420, partial [Clostridia bacterium]|nr:hypothetical protein [Clostridia bacterium]
PSPNTVVNQSGVRPALHLNLSLAAENAVAHEHEWQTGAGTDADGWKITKQATCTQTGSKERVCIAAGCKLTDSKEVETIEINPTAHTPGDPATCTTAQICTECNKEITAAKGHTEVTDKAVDPTCTETGKTAGSHCSVCNEILVAQTTIPANGHTEVEDEAVAPDCTNTGLTAGSHCSVCGVTLTAQQVVPENGHTASDWKVDKAATCTEAGARHKECTVCGTVLETETIDIIPHTPSDWKVDKEATCTEAGARHKECTVCTTTLESETIDKIPHTPGDEATCTQPQICTVCETELAHQLGHDYEAVEGGVAPTCTTAGSGKVRCTRCNDEQVGASIPALGHVEVTDEAKAATCTETGLTQGKHCSRC